MGGEREATVEQKTSHKMGQPVTTGKVRFHESNGEVHFHDDTNKLKAAVPVGIWYEAWQSLSTGQKKKFLYVDSVNQTMLTVKAIREKKKSTYDVIINVQSATFGSTFQALQKFTGVA